MKTISGLLALGLMAGLAAEQPALAQTSSTRRAAMVAQDKPANLAARLANPDKPGEPIA
jgi:hypothetical protein